MYKLLIALIVLLSLQTASANTLKLITDTVPKTICLPESSVRNLLIAAEQGKNAKDKVDLLTSQVSVLNDRITLLDSAITVYKEKGIVYDQQIKILQSEKKDYEDQKTLLRSEIADLNKQLKKERRQKKWIAVGGIAGTVGGIILTALLLK